MKKKMIRYGIVAAAIIIAFTNSVYFRSLAEVKASETAKKFDPASYANNFWNNELTPNLQQAIEIDRLIPKLHNEKEVAFDTYSNALGIGNIRYFLVSGEGKVRSVNTNDVSLVTGDGHELKIATEYIFGNAVRDASGMIDINEFTNTMDFNNISAEINRIIRNNVVPPFVERVKEGDRVLLVGAIELNQEHMNLNTIEVIPVKVEIGKGSE